MTNAPHPRVQGRRDPAIALLKIGVRQGCPPGQAPPVPPRSFPPVKPLSEDEFERLAEFLEAHSPFDTDGPLGVLNAVAVAPSLLPPSAWLPVVLPTGLGGLGTTEAQEVIGLLFRLHGDVLDALKHQQALMPAPEDVAECKAFAAGYAAGAEIDPEWISNADHWSFAAPMAYLGGRLDLVSEKTAQDIQLNFAPDPEQILLRSMGGLIRASHESFKKVRKNTLSQMAPAKPTASSRAGPTVPVPAAQAGSTSGAASIPVRRSRPHSPVGGSGPSALGLCMLDSTACQTR